MSKILFVSTCYPDEKLPQYCVFLEQQAKALVDLGNIVEVLVPLQTNNISCKFEQKTFNGLNVYSATYFVLRYDFLFSITTKDFYNKIYKLVNENKYDIISVHFAPDWMVKILNNISKRLYIKVVLHYHGLNVWQDYYVYSPFRTKFYAWKRKRIVNQIDAVIGVSNKVCNIVRTYSNNKNVYTVYNGVDISLFKPIKKEYDYSMFKVVCVANLIEIKGQKYLIEALKKLMDKNSEIKIILNLVGRGPYKAELEQLVNKLGLQNNVKFLGYINYDKVSEIIANSDVFVMPSFYEALGCVYLEAMASKVTVIGCKDQGINEIIIDNINGLLVEQQSAEDIFKKLDYLLNNPKRNDKIAQKGYETVVSNLTWKKSAENLNNIYNNLLKNKSHYL